MAKTLQFRRGTTAELASVTGAEGELFVDINKDTVVVMDGSTPGGKTLATEEFVLANAGGPEGGDAVFDSALIGDVSIVSNEISGVDSYGNAASLKVTSDLNVELGSQTTLNVNSAMPTGSLFYNKGSKSFQIYDDKSGGIFTFADWTALSNTIQAGSVITFVNAGFGSPIESFGDIVATVLSTNVESGGTGSYLNVVVSSLIIDGTDYINNDFSFTPGEVQVVSGSTSIVLEVTETGLNVNGALTVNGAPLNVSGSGATYDQELNTTDDVVFNSALIGDVSIVSNEISGVDSYGNATTLKVTSDLNVELGSQTTLNVVSQSSTSTLFYNKGSKSFQIGDITGGGPFSIDDYNSLVATIQAGSVITFVNAGFGSPTESFGDIVATVVSANVESGGTGSYLNVVVSSITYVGSDFINNDFTFLPGEVQVVNGSTSTVLEVTEAGVNVNGTFTVNGSTLNVLENTSSGKAITVESGDTEVVSTDYFAGPSFGNFNYAEVQGGTPSNKIVIYNVNPTTLGIELESLSIGDSVYIAQNSGAGEGTFVLTSTFAYDGAFDAYVALTDSTTTISGMAGTNYITVNKNVSTFQSSTFEFNSSGEFTVNGQPLSTGGTSYDQSLNTTDDVVFNSALVGDVSIVGNAISAVDSYGLSGDLILDGTVVYTGSITETPTNTSSINKWLKVGAEVTIPGSVVNYNLNQGTDYPNASVFINDNPGFLIFLNYGSWYNSQAEQATKNLVVGTQITFVTSIDTYIGTIDSILNQDGNSQYSIAWNGTGPDVEQQVISLSFNALGTSTQGIEYFYMPLYK